MPPTDPSSSQPRREEAEPARLRRLARVVVAGAAIGLAGAAAAFAVGSSGTRLQARAAHADTTFTFTNPPPLLRTVSTPFVPHPMLTATITSNVPSLMAGIPATVTIIVTQKQGVTAGGVTLTVTGIGPPLFTVQSATTDAGTCDTTNNPYQCSLGDMTQNQRATIVLTVLPLTSGTANIAVTTAASDPSSTNTPGALSLPVKPASADLAVRLPSTETAPKVGRKLRLGVVVSNFGPSPALKAALTLKIPSNTRLVLASPRQGSCKGTPLVCTLGPLTPGAATLIVLTLEATKTGKGSLKARASSELADALASNDQATTAIDVAGS